MASTTDKEPGRFLRHAPCNSCGSSDAFALYEQPDGSVDGTCFSCGTYDSDPLNNLGETIEHGGEVREFLTPERAQEYPIRDLPERGVTYATAHHFGVRVTLNQADGTTPSAYLFPYYHADGELAFKKRYADHKHFTIIGNGRSLPFFGQHLFEKGGRKLFITEGEIDALSLFQVLKQLAGRGYEHINPAVVSLPNGASSAARTVHEQEEFLNKFDEIILAFDQDEEGRKAVEKVCSILDPNKVRVARFSEKDANDMLLAGKQEELKWSVISNAKQYIPSGISTVDELYDQAINPPVPGNPWPWPSLTALTYGRAPGVYLVGAGVGVGKTEWLHELMGHIVNEERSPVGVFLLEESPTRTLNILAGKQAGISFHRPDVEYEEEQLKNALDSLRYPENLVYIFNHRGDRDWSSIYHQIRHIVAVHGVRDIFIDPLTAVISHEENTDRTLHAIMDDISRLTHEPYNCSVYVSSHLNEPPRDSTPHEEGGRVRESQFAGSRAMIRFSNYVFGLERNKQDPDLLNRNTTTLRVLKDREYGTATGETFQLYYNPKENSYKEFGNHVEF